MADIDKRLHYFNGQFLQDVDFNAEQAYHLDRERRHNRLMHTYGIAEGLAVTAPAGATSVTVAPGTALDGQGQLVVLTQGDSRTLQLNTFLSKTVLVVISYAEATSDPASVGGSGNTRWQERPNVQLVVDDANAPPVDMYLRLARLTINAAGATTAAADLTPRVSAGVKPGTDVPIQTLRLSNPNFAPNLWPVFTSNAANEADLAGTLAASIDVKVGASGQSVLTHLGATNNPHATTAAQVGAITGVGGVINPGGSVNLATGGAIVLTPDNSANKRITISETHSALTGNPHGTLAAQLSDYDYGKRSIVSVSFTNSDADGAARTLNLGFQPRFLWASGGFNIYLSGGWNVGSPVSGFAELRSGINQNGHYLFSYRVTSAPYASYYAQLTASALGSQYFIDYSTTPNQQLSTSVSITSVTSTGLVLTFNRSTGSGYGVPSFYVTFALVCVG